MITREAFISLSSLRVAHTLFICNDRYDESRVDWIIEDVFKINLDHSSAVSSEENDDCARK